MGFHDIAKILLLVIATLLGTSFSLWRGGPRRGWVGGFALLGISLLLAIHGDHPLRLDSPPVVWVALLAGFCFGLSFPCCAPAKRVGPVAILATVVMVVHCLLDGHVVREVHTYALLAMFGVHKFVDGADGRLLSLESERATLIARASLVLATPIGFVAIPPGATSPVVHLSLFAGVIGFNMGTALHILCHELQGRALARVATTPSRP